MQPNNALERTVMHRGPRLAAAPASWPAAQLGRQTPLHAYLAVLIRSDAIVACIALGDANPKCITYTSELEAMGLGDFVGTAGSFSSLDMGILKLHDKPSEVFDSLLDIGFNAIILNPVAVEAFASENGYSAVSAPVVIELLRSVSDASCNGV